MRSVLCIGVLLGAAPAAAGVIEVELEGEPTFDRQELEAAVDARGVNAGRVAVRVVDDTAIITLGERQREVVLGGHRGGDAARLVAIAIRDLAVELPSVPAPPLRTVREPGLRLAAWAVGAAATGALEPLGLGAALDASLPVGPLQAALTLHAAWSGADTPGFSLKSLTLRPAVGWRLGVAELRAAPALTAYRVSGGHGHSGLLVGGGAAVVVRWPVFGGASLSAAAGADVYAQRARFEASGAAVLETPRVWFWAGAGLGWEWGR